MDQYFSKKRRYYKLNKMLMRTFFLRLGFTIILMILSSTCLFSNTIADSTIVFEDDKIYILDFGDGSSI